MRFSIIVPIYNVSDYLTECLVSIQNQTYKDFECILVDDGSTDNSSAICDNFANSDSRFKVVHKPNEGLVSARKTGVGVSSGDYILNVDGDDYIGNNLLEQISNIIEQCSPSGIYFGYTPFGGNTGKPILNNCPLGIYTGEKLKFLRNSYLYNSKVSGINSGTVLFNICTKCIRRDLYIKSQKVVPNNITSGEDTVFTLYLSKIIDSVYVSDNSGYFYRQSSSSIEHQFNPARISDLYKLYGVMQDITNDNSDVQNAINVYLFYRLWFYLCGMAIYSDSYKQYKSLIKNTKLIDLPNTIINHNVQSKIKFALIKNKMYFALFMLSKTYFKRRLEL